MVLAQHSFRSYFALRIFFLFLGLYFFYLSMLTVQAHSVSPESPTRILYDSKRSSVYVLAGDKDFWIVDKETLENKRRVPVGIHVEDFALNKENGKLYFVDNFPPRLIELTPADNLGNFVSRELNLQDVSLPGVGTELFQVETDESSSNVFVLDRPGEKFHIIDAKQLKVKKSFSVGYAPHFVFNSARNEIYIQSQGLGGVEVIDVVTGSKKFIPTGPLPSEMVLDPSKQRLVVLDRIENKLSIIDTRLDVVLSTLSLGVPSTFITFRGSSDQVFVSTSGGRILVVNLASKKIEKSIELPEESIPERAFIDTKSGIAYVPSFGSFTIALINLITLKVDKVVPSGDLREREYYRHAVLDKVGFIDEQGVLYLIYPHSKNISKLSPSGDIIFHPDTEDPSAIQAPDDAYFFLPRGLAFDAENRVLYVLNRAGFITYVDAKTNQPLGRMAIGKWPVSILYDSSTKRLYVSHGGSDPKITVIDSSEKKILNEIAVNVRGVRMFLTKNGELYFFDYVKPAIGIIDKDLRFFSRTTTFEPGGGWYDNESNKLFIAFSRADKVGVIDASSHQLIKEISVGKLPRNISKIGSKIVVANSADNFLTLINPNTLEVDGRVSFPKPGYVARHEPTGKVLIIDIYGAQVGIFDASFSQKKILPLSQTKVRNFGIIRIIAGEKYFYVIDDPDGRIFVVDPTKEEFILDYHVLLEGLAEIPIHSFVSGGNDILYLSHYPESAVSFFDFSDIKNVVHEPIQGTFKIPLAKEGSYARVFVLIAALVILLTASWLILKGRHLKEVVGQG